MDGTKSGIRFILGETLTYLKTSRGCVSVMFSGERRENVCHII